MRNLKIEEAFQISTNYLRQNGTLKLLIPVLLNDGFSKQQTQTIVLWAMNQIKKENES